MSNIIEDGCKIFQKHNIRTWSVVPLHNRTETYSTTIVSVCVFSQFAEPETSVKIWMSSQQINLSLGTMESLLEVFFNYGIVHVYKVGCNGVCGRGGWCYVGVCAQGIQIRSLLRPCSRWKYTHAPSFSTRFDMAHSIGLGRKWKAKKSCSLVVCLSGHFCHIYAMGCRSCTVAVGVAWNNTQKYRLCRSAFKLALRQRTILTLTSDVELRNPISIFIIRAPD